jgi:hypothetical protein
MCDMASSAEHGHCSDQLGMWLHRILISTPTSHCSPACYRSVQSMVEHQPSHLSMCSSRPPSDWCWQGTSRSEAEAIMAVLQAAAG